MRTYSNRKASVCSHQICSRRECNRHRIPNSFIQQEADLTVGFALGYGIREWAFRQSHRAGQRRRRPF
jgi:hypothetical protein